MSQDWPEFDGGGWRRWCSLSGGGSKQTETEREREGETNKAGNRELDEEISVMRAVRDVAGRGGAESLAVWRVEARRWGGDAASHVRRKKTRAALFRVFFIIIFVV